MNNADLVWYASYGSNLSRQRFLCFIQGGQPRGTLRACEGARDRTPPHDDRPLTIHHPLYFAWESRIWRGGMAFLGHENDRSHITLARMYLITMGQLEDILAQENAMDNLPIGADVAAADQAIPYMASKYACLIQLGQIDDTPILTFTSNEDMASHPLNPPSIDYLHAMAEGLRESFGMGPKELVDYFSQKPGIAGRIDTAMLTEWFQPER